MRRLHGIKKGRAPAARALILIRSLPTHIYTCTAVSAKPVFRGCCDQYWSLARPVLLRAVTSTGSLSDQYWSQSPSSEAPNNYLYTREVRRTASELPPHAGQAVGPDRYEEGQRTAAPRTVYVLSAELTTHDTAAGRGNIPVAPPRFLYLRIGTHPHLQGFTPSSHRLWSTY